MRWIVAGLSVIVGLVVLQAEGSAKAPPLRALDGKDKHVAEDLLKSGHHLLRNREYSLAQDYYRQVIGLYPGTRYEKVAQRSLKRAEKLLQNEQKQPVARRGFLWQLFTWRSRTPDYVP